MQPTLGLCAAVALEFRPPKTTARLFTKDKCLEPMFGVVGQARTNADMLLMPIATTSSHTCTKPIVVGSFTCQTLMILEALNKGLHSFCCQKEY